MKNVLQDKTLKYRVNKRIIKNYNLMKTDFVIRTKFPFFILKMEKRTFIISS